MRRSKGSIYVLQYKTESSPILSLPASSNAFSSAWRHRHSFTSNDAISLAKINRTSDTHGLRHLLQSHCIAYIHPHYNSSSLSASRCTPSIESSWIGRAKLLLDVSCSSIDVRLETPASVVIRQLYAAVRLHCRLAMKYISHPGRSLCSFSKSSSSRNAYSDAMVGKLLQTLMVARFMTRRKSVWRCLTRLDVGREEVDGPLRRRSCWSMKSSSVIASAPGRWLNHC